MEFIVIVIIVVILFNVIGSLSRQGGRTAPPGRTGRPGPAPETRREPRLFVDEISRSRHAGPLPSGEGTSREGPGLNSPKSLPVETPHAAPEGEDAPGVVLGLQNMLQRKDDLIAAFIFHEILEKPRSMQRR